MDWLKRVDVWCFGRGRPESMGLLRVLCGFFVFTNLLVMGTDLMNYFGQKGFVSGETMARWLAYPSNKIFYGSSLEMTLPFSMPRISVIGPNSSDTWVVTVWVCSLILSLCFMLGFKARFTGVLLALGMTSLHLRNPLIIHAGDSLLRLFVIYLALGHSSAAFSLDRLFEARRGLAQRAVSLWPQRLIQIQIAICYVLTAWWKWTGSTWVDGTATWYSSQLHEFDRFPVPDFVKQQPFVGLTTYGTLLVEVALGTLVFYPPARKWVLLSGIALHSYIEYSFNIPFFATTIVSGYIAFYQGEEVAGWLHRFKDRWLKRGTLTSDAASEV